MIFTDRQITVHKGKSSIDEPVILYRGDYEVSIKFTIIESKLRFKSGVNLVDSGKASFGQLAILAPYGGNVFSEVVKFEDGSVTFTLTKEMIDQLEEVGLYSFQIRLFDYYRESRVSIPPVEFGIEVREPVASEDHDNEVNNAIVGYSIAKVVDGLNEDVRDTFDGNDNYNKTDWKTGDRISQGKLNKIEDALDKINQNEKNDVATLNKRVNNNFNVLDASKADATQIHGLQTQVNNLVLGAVGDGNNPEVIQARGDYNLLNDRMQILDSAVKSENFGYIDLSDTQFVSGLNEHRMTINCVPITKKGTVVVHYMPAGKKVYIQHLRFVPESQTFKILSTITVDVTQFEYTKTVCDFKIDTSGNDFIGIEGVDHSTNYADEPGYCFMGWYRGDTSITQYDVPLKRVKGVSMGYYVEVFNTNDVEVQEQINEINNIISYSETFGYVDLNDPSYKGSCRIITNCIPITKTGKVIVTLNPTMPTIFIQHLRYNGSDTFTIVNTVKCKPVGDVVTSIECDFDIDPSGYDYIAVDGAKVSNTLTNGYCILHSTNYTEESGLTEYKIKLTTTRTAAVGFYVTVTGCLTDFVDDINDKVIDSFDSLNKLEDDLNKLEDDLNGANERIDDLENHFKYIKSFDAENIEVNMLNKGFWNQGNVYVHANDSWTYFYHIDEPIPVAPGEVYLIKNIVGTGNLHPILLRGDKSSTWDYVYPDSKEIPGTVLYEEILLTIPDNIDYMYLNTTNTKGPVSNLSVQKLSNIVYDFVDVSADVNVVNSRIDETNGKLDELNFELNHLKTRCTKYDNFEFKWGAFDKRYFAITIDDSNSALGGFYDVAHARNIPISTACVWSKLSNVESGGSRTIRDINNLIVADGGEILGHYTGSPTDDTPYETWIELMRTPKKKLEEEGWTIRGLIRADSTPRATNKGQRICREYYDYSDTVGISKHYNMGVRKFLIGVNTLDEFKAWVNDSCTANGFYPICVHGLRDDEPLATNENLGAIIDYILSLENVEFTTYRDMFDRFGTIKLD